MAGQFLHGLLRSGPLGATSTSRASDRPLDDQAFDLAAAVALARRMLSANPRGYFLMVESDTHTGEEVLVAAQGPFGWPAATQ